MFLNTEKYADNAEPFMVIFLKEEILLNNLLS